MEILLRVMFQCSKLLQAASKPTMPLAGAGIWRDGRRREKSMIQHTWGVSWQQLSRKFTSFFEGPSRQSFGWPVIAMNWDTDAGFSDLDLLEWEADQIIETMIFQSFT